MYRAKKYVEEARGEDWDPETVLGLRHRPGGCRGITTKKTLCSFNASQACDIPALVDILRRLRPALARDEKVLMPLARAMLCNAYHQGQRGRLIDQWKVALDAEIIREEDEARHRARPRHRAITEKQLEQLMTELDELRRRESKLKSEKRAARREAREADEDAEEATQRRQDAEKRIEGLETQVLEAEKNRRLAEERATRAEQQAEQDAQHAKKWENQFREMEQRCRALVLNVGEAQEAAIERAKEAKQSAIEAEQYRQQADAHEVQATLETQRAGELEGRVLEHEQSRLHAEMRALQAEKELQRHGAALDAERARVAEDRAIFDDRRRSLDGKFANLARQQAQLDEKRVELALQQEKVGQQLDRLEEKYNALPTPRATPEKERLGFFRWLRPRRSTTLLETPPAGVSLRKEGMLAPVTGLQTPPRTPEPAHPLEAFPDMPRASPKPRRTSPRWNRAMQ